MSEKLMPASLENRERRNAFMISATARPTPWGGGKIMETSIIRQLYHIISSLSLSVVPSSQLSAGGIVDEKSHAFNQAWRGGGPLCSDSGL